MKTPKNNNHMKDLSFSDFFQKLENPQDIYDTSFSGDFKIKFIPSKGLLHFLLKNISYKYQYHNKPKNPFDVSKKDIYLVAYEVIDSALTFSHQNIERSRKTFVRSFIMPVLIIMAYTLFYLTTGVFLWKSFTGLLIAFSLPTIILFFRNAFVIKRLLDSIAVMKRLQLELTRKKSLSL
jgi:hypothetical protein